MPILIEAGAAPPRWAERQGSLSAAKVRAKEPEGVRIAFINNMPDSALEDTEVQFLDLLDASSGEIPVRIELFSLPGVARGDRGQQHLKSFYASTEELWDRHFDGLIITGTEPRQPNLKDEPYWQSLVKVLDWAEQHTVSTILSCLAAHAGVLYSDGIARHQLSDKQFGVFEYKSICDHPLTSGSSSAVRFPHSRWNEVREDRLTSSGYTILTRSVHAGVDSFIKHKKKSLFVHLQGHPEYQQDTLLKEYKRDIKRFLRGERETYPSMPHGYFDAATTAAFTIFHQNALKNRCEDCISDFPGQAVLSDLKNTWRSSATGLYKNWVQYVLSRKADAAAFSPLIRSGRQPLAATVNGEVV